MQNWDNFTEYFFYHFTHFISCCYCCCCCFTQRHQIHDTPRPINHDVFHSSFSFLSNFFVLFPIGVFFFYLVWVFFSVSVKVQNRVGALRLRCVKYRLTVINERATPPLRHSAATPPLLRRYCHPQRLTAFIKALMNTFLFFHCEMFKQSEFKGKTWKLTLITSNYTTTFCRVACKQHFFTR